MKFLCIPCDKPMQVQTTGGSETGSLSLTFHCSSCGHEIAMLTNTAETQLVQSLGVRVGHGEKPVTPLAQVRAHLTQARPESLIEDTAPEPAWTKAAEARLAEHPRFVQPVIRKTYTDYARREGLREITTEVMDAARRAVGGPG